MKLATYRRDGIESYGIVTDEGLRDIPSMFPQGPRDLLGLLQAGPDALATVASLAASARSFLPLSEVRLLAPLPQPPKLLGLAVNYVEHHREFQRDSGMPDDPRHTTTPRPFLMPTTAVAAPHDEIPWPTFSDEIDHEIELAVVIGRTAKCVPPEAARGHVFGYTIANDISARRCTHSDGRLPRDKDAFFDWLHGKWADAFCPLGPVLVTADEIPDPHDLRLTLTVNGEVRQDDTTRNMIHTIDQIVSFCSHLMTLAPGDVIATGTPSGVGKATGKLLRAGDTVTCRIDRIGELTNTLGARPTDFYRPCEGTRH